MGTISLAVSTATLIILIMGLVIAWEAKKSYQTANKVAISSTLYKLDYEIHNNVMNQTYLRSVFIVLPADELPKVKADKRLQLVNTHFNELPSWNTIPELMDIAWGEYHFNKEYSASFCAVYYFSESILYLLNAAYESYSVKAISQEDYRSWAGYLTEIGDHPIFLGAVYYAHYYGYITKKFANEIQKHYSGTPHLKATVKSLYPEMLENNWPRQVGQHIYKTN